MLSRCTTTVCEWAAILRGNWRFPSRDSQYLDDNRESSDGTARFRKAVCENRMGCGPNPRPELTVPRSDLTVPGKELVVLKWSARFPERSWRFQDKELAAPTRERTVKRSNPTTPNSDLRNAASAAYTRQAGPAVLPDEPLSTTASARRPCARTIPSHSP